MRRLLEFCEDQNSIWWHGALWAIGMAFTELMRVLLFGMCWGIPYRLFIFFLSFYNSNNKAGYHS